MKTPSLVSPFHGIAALAAANLLLLAGCAMPPPAAQSVDPLIYVRAVNSPARTDADRQADAGANPWSSCNLRRCGRATRCSTLPPVAATPRSCCAGGRSFRQRHFARAKIEPEA
ncbi:MAG: hypothetical protein WDN04_26505 [Rhodospirillales bacterium]